MESLLESSGIVTAIRISAKLVVIAGLEQGFSAISEEIADQGRAQN
jgi:hypothetical protein